MGEFIDTSNYVAGTIAQASHVTASFLQADAELVAIRAGEVFSTRLWATFLVNDILTPGMADALHMVSAQSGVTDDLSTIDATGVAVGRLLLLRANFGHTITIKHAFGNIKLNGGADFALTNDNSLLLYYDGTNWHDLGAGGGAAAPTPSTPASILEIQVFS